jgi:hypothetical protein
MGFFDMEVLPIAAFLFFCITFIYLMWRGWNDDYCPRHPDEDAEGDWHGGRFDPDPPIVPKGSGGGGRRRHDEEPIYCETVARKLVESATPTVKA